MAFAVLHIFSRAGFRIAAFFRAWYVDGAHFAARKTFAMLERLDRRLALRVTLEHFFEPLYQDHSVVGHILGFLFRSVRVLAALCIYGSVIIIAALLYALWAAVVAYALYRALFFFPV